jgi:pimeloyl-ACP methyl ester carboxylesterase
MRNDARLPEGLALELAELSTRQLPDGRFVFKHDPLHVTRGPYPFRSDFARAFWERITCPVLLVEGADSPFQLLPGRQERIDAFRGATVQVIADAGHMLQRHQPALLAHALTQFLT